MIKPMYQYISQPSLERLLCAADDNPHNCSKYREPVCKTMGSQLDSNTMPPRPKPQGSSKKEEAERLKKPDAAGDYNETLFSGTTGQLHVWTHSGCKRMHQTNAKSNQSKPTMEGGSGVRKSSPLLKSDWKRVAAGVSGQLAFLGN